MTPEKIQKLKAVFTLAITSGKVAHIVRGFNSGQPSPMPIKDRQFLALHERALADLEAGTLDFELFQKRLQGLIESNVPDLTKGGFISPTQGEGGISLYDGGEFKPI